MQSLASKFEILLVKPDSFAELYTALKTLLESYNVTFHTVSHPDYSELAQIKSKDAVQAVFLASGRSSIDVIMKEFPNIKWCHNFFTGVDKLLLDETFRKSSITLTTSRGASAYGLTEHAIGMMIYFSRRFREWDQLQAKAEWKALYSTDISRKKITIVGYGSIGSKLGRMCKVGFDMKVTGVKRSIDENTYKEHPEVEKFYSLKDLATACEDADFVVNILPKTEETIDVYNKSIFDRFKKTAVFINIGRGLNVVEEDLIDALKQGKIAAAGLDVFREEPLPKDSPFYTEESIKEKIFISCHKADQSDLLLYSVVDLAKKNLENFLNNKPLAGIVDKEKGY